MSIFRTIILSGGGAKGPYGVGALRALAKMETARGKPITKIFFGTSVGALSATLAAQGEMEILSNLYSNIRTKDILGTDDPSVGTLTIGWKAKQTPFFYFDNTSLKATIKRYAKFKSLVNAHLSICATNYTSGEFETFYVSELIDDFVQKDNMFEPENRQLTGFHRITSQDELENALLASTALPFFFAPVKINDAYYVDGGVGNNTPLKQASAVNRFLSEDDTIQILPAFCVINDPNHFTIDLDSSKDLSGVLRRTLAIPGNALFKDAKLSWDKINREVRRSKDNLEIIFSRIQALEGAPADAIAALKLDVAKAFTQPGSVKRIDLPLWVVQPGDVLVDDILNFDPAKSKAIQRRGTADCLLMLQNRNAITDAENHRWDEELG